MECDNLKVILQNKEIENNTMKEELKIKNQKINELEDVINTNNIEIQKMKKEMEELKKMLLGKTQVQEQTEEEQTEEDIENFINVFKQPATTKKTKK